MPMHNTASQDGRERMTENISRSKLKRIVLPAIIFQSVGMGGAFATGREIITYMAKYGSLGLVSIVSYITALTAFGVVIYTFAYTHKLYDYKSFIKNLLWKGWPVFEILYIMITVLFMASFLSAGGIILNRYTGLPSFVASIIFVFFIAAILYFGRDTIEKVSTVGTLLIYVVFAAMFVIILSQRWDQAINTITTGNTAYVNDPSIISAARSGLVFSGSSIIVFMPVLFTVDRMESKRDAILSGLLSSVLITAVIALAYLSLMGFYPNESVMGAPVPWTAMLRQSGNTMIISILTVSYIAVLFLTFIETGVGYIHSMTDRIDDTIKSSSFSLFEDVDELSARQRGLFTIGVIVSALLLSRIGIIALISQGYTMLAYIFLTILVIPLFTIGIYRIYHPSWKQTFWNEYLGLTTPRRKSDKETQQGD